MIVFPLIISAIIFERSFYRPMIVRSWSACREIILQTLTALFDAKVEELALRYEKAWRSTFVALKEDDSTVLIS